MLPLNAKPLPELLPLLAMVFLMFLLELTAVVS